MTPSDQPDPVIVDCNLDEPPETVWRALTRAQNNNQDKKVAIEEIA